MRGYQLAHHLSLVAGPLQIATVGDFHDVAFMRMVAGQHTDGALAYVTGGRDALSGRGEATGTMTS
jgi:hypothetical protein